METREQVEEGTLGRDETGRALIDPALCIGCGHCTQYCRFDAIVKE